MILYNIAVVGGVLRPELWGELKGVTGTRHFSFLVIN
jgi:hypothetical protein